MDRLDKILAGSGLGSRKEIKQLLRTGGVLVDGQEVRDPSLHIDPAAAQITVFGKPFHYQKYVYLMMNKPDGVVSATEDNRFPTVVDLLDEEARRFAPFPVGRLDRDTEGFLLLTNDGQTAHRLLSPRKHVPKTYLAQLAQDAQPSYIVAFEQGVTLEDGYQTLPAQLVLDENNPRQIQLTIYEGKFHQVKRMFEAVGNRVCYLKRIRFGSVPLDETLQPGEYRPLSTEECKKLGIEEII